MAGHLSRGDGLRGARRGRGFSQEQLAERAGLGVSTVRRIEQGESVRMETLHRLARVLEVETSALYAPTAPTPVRDGGDDVNLIEFRRVLTPGVSVEGVIPSASSGTPGRRPGSPTLRSSLAEAVSLYHANDYDAAARLLPRAVHDAHVLVAAAAGDEARSEALRLRAEAFQVAGWFLTQVRRYDLAYSALHRSVEDGASAGDTPTAAAGVIAQCWLLIRQGRFDEAEQLASACAAEVEPRAPTASVRELSAWGWLLLRGSAAAVRNNRSDVSDDFLELAETAAVRVGERGRGPYHPYWATFNASTVHMKSAEALMIVGDARGVLRLAERVRWDRRRPSDNLNRHLLDVANSHALLGDAADAVEVLAGLRRTQPEWLRHQRRAADVLRRLLAARRRALTQEMRELAAFLAVDE